jgi:two-component system, NtrC family, sensor kinase
MDDEPRGWNRSELEREVAQATRMLEATAELCRIFAQDISEKANIAAVDVLKRYFAAAGAALFYVNGRREFHFCLAGVEYPIALPEKRWRECVGNASDASRVTRFGPWAPPGFGQVEPFWISAELYSAQNNVGFVLMGRSSAWSDEDELALESISYTIAPIVGVRIEREREEHVRHQAELLLAENEKRLRAFFEDSRDMIYTANSEDVVSSINAAGLALTGRSEKHEILGHPFSALALNAADREYFLSRIREEGYVVDYEIILVRKDGSSVFCLETAHTLKGPKGEILEFQGIIKDISERIKNEGELWKANLELAETNLKLQQTQGLMVQQEKLASIGQLAAGIAHEINNPIGFLKSNHAMLQRYVSMISEAWKEARAAAGPVIGEIEARLDLGFVFSAFDAIFPESEEGFSRIMRIIGNLKNFSRIDQGGDFGPFDVNAGIESTLIVARNAIKYVADTHKNLGELPPIKARGGEINQVILNILVNAAQAIESQKRATKGLIEIETRRQGEMVRILIHDDGPGIPESIQRRVFDPFFTTKEPGKGTGLGLSISYDIIVTKHGGRLSLESDPGEGSTFIIELPIEGAAPLAG